MFTVYTGWYTTQHCSVAAGVINETMLSLLDVIFEIICLHTCTYCCLGRHHSEMLMLGLSTVSNRSFYQFSRCLQPSASDYLVTMQTFNTSLAYTECK